MASIGARAVLSISAMSRGAGARWLLSLFGLCVFAMLALSASSGSFVGAGVGYLAERPRTDDGRGHCSLPAF